MGCVKLTAKDAATPPKAQLCNKVALTVGGVLAVDMVANVGVVESG
jgi:hypothetical protein